MVVRRVTGRLFKLNENRNNNNVSIIISLGNKKFEFHLRRGVSSPLGWKPSRNALERSYNAVVQLASFVHFSSAFQIQLSVES